MKRTIMTLAAGFAAIAALSLQAAPTPQVETNLVITETSDTTVTLDPYRVETRSFWDNWNVSAGAGPQIYFGDHNRQLRFGDRISPALDVAIAKWFSPSIGVRLEYSGLSVRGATQHGAHSTGEAIKGKPWYGYWLTYQKFNFFNIHLDAMFNLHNIISGYRPNRFWNTTIHAGVGMARVWEAPGATEVTLNIGWLNSFRLSNKFDAFADLRGMMVHNRFSGEEGGRNREGILALTVGITYWFTNGWNHPKTIVREISTTQDISALNERINQMTAENLKLREMVKEGRDSEVRPVLNRIANSIFIAFPINKWTLSDEARVNIGLLAEVIKASGADDMFLITGYADSATGSEEGNLVLSRNRAEAVYNCLVNEFGINKNQLTIDYKGGVENMFYNDPRLSRATIIRVK